jgi:hypothetical protein
MSSENLSINFHPLLNEVPPLRIKNFAYGLSNNAFSVSVTHQSFSIAFSAIPLTTAACAILVLLC